MSEAERLVRRYIEEVWNLGNLISLNELTAPGFRYYLGGQTPRDRDAFGRFIVATRQAFPDWSVEIDQVIVDAPSVAVRWHGRATHTGPFRGLPPTGRAITVTGMNIYVIQDGRIASEWEQMDSLGMLQQLGVLPA